MSTTKAKTAAKDGAAKSPAPRKRRQPEVEGKAVQAASTDANKLSALDAAAKVLEKESRPMSCQEMIQAMAEKGYWSSPGGKTPASTLYSAILRELQAKGKEARFAKIERGKFAFQKA